MQKRNFTLVLLIAVAILMVVLTAKVFRNISLRLEQAGLAEKLGENVENYFPAKSFPKNYFYSILQKGMTKADVHKIVVGYEAVFTCSQYSELYYYYSVNDSKALRFKIFYDSSGKYYKILGEDDSSKLYDEGCFPGRLDN